MCQNQVQGFVIITFMVLSFVTEERKNASNKIMLGAILLGWFRGCSATEV